MRKTPSVAVAARLVEDTDAAVSKAVPASRSDVTAVGAIRWRKLMMGHSPFWRIGARVTCRVELGDFVTARGFVSVLR
jgi:hypothetical protein